MAAAAAASDGDANADAFADEEENGLKRMWALIRPAPKKKSGDDRRKGPVRINTSRQARWARSGYGTPAARLKFKDRLIEECIPIFQYGLGAETGDSVKVVLWVKGATSRQAVFGEDGSVVKKKLKWTQSANHGPNAVFPGKVHRPDIPYSFTEFMNGRPRIKKDPTKYVQMCKNLMARAKKEAMNPESGGGFRENRDRLRPAMMSYHPGATGTVDGKAVPVYNQLNRDFLKAGDDAAVAWRVRMEGSAAWKNATKACIDDRISDDVAAKRLGAWVQRAFSLLTRQEAGLADQKGYWRTVRLGPDDRLEFLATPTAEEIADI